MEGWRFYVATTLISLFMSFVGIVFSNGIFPVSFCRVAYMYSWQQSGLFGDVCGVPVTNNSIRCSPMREVLFVDSRWSFGTLCPLLFSFHSHVYACIFRKFLLYHVSILPIKCSLILFFSINLFPYSPSPPLDSPIAAPFPSIYICSVSLS